MTIPQALNDLFAGESQAYGGTLSGRRGCDRGAQRREILYKGLTGDGVVIIITGMEAANSTAKYTAYIMGDDDLIKVDLRDLDTDKLRQLRAEAIAAGDSGMVATITEVLGS